MEGEESKDHFHVLQPARFVTVQFPPCLLFFEALQNLHQFAAIECHSDLLRLEVDPSSIEALEDYVDTAILVLLRIVLPYDSGVNDAVVEPTTVFRI